MALADHAPRTGGPDATDLVSTHGGTSTDRALPGDRPTTTRKPVVGVAGSVPGRRITDRTALAVAVAAVSTSAILVRFSRAPSTVAALYRVALTALLVVPLVATRHGRAFRTVGARDGLLAGAAGVALAVHFAAWFESLDHTSVAASVTLVQTQPVFVALGAWAALDERVTRRTAAGIAVAVAGAAAMALGGGQGATGGGLAGARYGNALALFGAVAAAAYVLVGRSVRRRLPVLPYVLVVYAVCAAVLLGVVVARGLALGPYPPREWLLFLGMAVGPGLLGHTVVNWTLARVGSTVVSVSLLGEPVGSTVLALALLGEVPSAATLAGGVVVLCGIYVTATARHDEG